MAFPYLTDVLHAIGVDLPLPIPTFGLLVGIAFFTGMSLATKEARRIIKVDDPDFMSTACIIGFLTGLLGARLFHLLEYPRDFMANPMGMLFSRAGFTIFGGVHAPYLWIRTKDGAGSWDFFDQLLTKAQVVGTPGAGFGANGEGFFRLSAFNSRANVEEAIVRIQSRVKVS